MWEKQDYEGEIGTIRKDNEKEDFHGSCLSILGREETRVCARKPERQNV